MVCLCSLNVSIITFIFVLSLVVTLFVEGINKTKVKGKKVKKGSI